MTNNSVIRRENVTFDELSVGQSASVLQKYSREEMPLSGDSSWLGRLFSTLVMTDLPGTGTIVLSENLEFRRPVRADETIQAMITVQEKKSEGHIAVFACRGVDALGEIVVDGWLRAIIPTQKIRQSVEADQAGCGNGQDRFRNITDVCRSLPPLTTAVVHPVTAAALVAASEAAQQGFIEPVLVGPESRIHAAADQAEVDIGIFELIAAPHSHGAACKAVELAARGDVAALMKGSLSTDELLSAVVPSSAGMRTERRISHAYVMDIPTYHKLLVITDAAISIAPNLDEKADICRNAIDLWRVMMRGQGLPKVAVLAATEKVKSDMQATVDAACLCKMADRKQIGYALLDGPLALDLAISHAATHDKGLDSVVAGDADILVAPDINSANMVAKQLTFLGHACAAGIVLGARVPIILTSRADSARTRLMSCALAVLMADAKQRGAVK